MIFASVVCASMTVRRCCSIASGTEQPRRSTVPDDLPVPRLGDDEQPFARLPPFMKEFRDSGTEGFRGVEQLKDMLTRAIAVEVTSTTGQGTDSGPTRGRDRRKLGRGPRIGSGRISILYSVRKRHAASAGSLPRTG